MDTESRVWSQDKEHKEHFQESWLEGEERVGGGVVGDGGQFQGGKDQTGKKKRNMTLEQIGWNQ